MTVTPIRMEDCYALWKDVRPLLEPAIEKSDGRWRNEYVFAALITGQQKLWTITDDSGIIAAFTTALSQYPEKRMLAIHFLGGDGFDQWYPDMLKAVTEHGKKHNCAGIECNARAGFWRWFKPDGWEKASVFYEIKI